MSARSVRIIFLQVVLMFLLVNFNNCSGGFESGGLGGGELSEQDSSSAGTGAPPEESTEEPTGPVDKEPDFCTISGNLKSSELLSVDVEGRDFILKWIGAECAIGHELIVDRQDMGPSSFLSKEVSEYRVRGLDYGEHCFKLETHFPIQFWTNSNQLCATSRSDEAVDPDPTSGSEIELTSKSYFVDPDRGSDSSSGLTPKGAWKTLSKVSALRERSPKVYLKSGGVFDKQKLKVRFGGTRSDMAKISCYFMEAEVPYECGDQHDKPVIRGDLTLSCIRSGTCDYSAEGYRKSIMSSQWDALVDIEETGDYLVVRKIRIELSRSSALRASGDKSEGSLTHFILEDIDVQYTGDAPVVIQNGVQDFVVRRMTVDYYNLCEQQRSARTASLTSTEACNPGGWPGGIIVVRSNNARGLIENNLVTRGFGEAYNCYSRTSHMIIRGNRASNVWSNGVYLDVCKNSVVENNILLGTNGDLGFYKNVNGSWGRSGNGPGIVVGWEDVNLKSSSHYHGTGNLIRNNLVVSTGSGLILGTEAEAAKQGIQVGAKIFGNTFINSSRWDLRTWTGRPNISEFNYKNNLSWNETVAAEACLVEHPLDLGFNHWFVSPRVQNCRSPGDSLGLPGISQGRYAHWSEFNYMNFPTFEMARPQAGSPLRGSGTSEPVNTKVLNAGDYGFAFEQISDSIDRSCWEKGLCYDALNVRRNSASVTKGAVQ